MKKLLLLVFAFILLLSGCRQIPPENILPENDASSVNQQNPGQATGDQPRQNTEQNTPLSPSLDFPQETLGADCYGDDTHPIGQSVADLYPDQTNYEEVMIWFCNGFEFEDILTALQTAEDTEYNAEELLMKFEQGQTWEEIWQELDIVSP